MSSEQSWFNYSLGGNTSSSFQYPDHQLAFFDQLTLTNEQMEQRGHDKQCAYDYIQTWDIQIGLATMTVQKSNTMDKMVLGMLEVSPQLKMVL